MVEATTNFLKKRKIFFKRSLSWIYILYLLISLLKSSSTFPQKKYLVFIDFTGNNQTFHGKYLLKELTKINIY